MFFDGPALVRWSNGKGTEIALNRPKPEFFVSEVQGIYNACSTMTRDGGGNSFKSFEEALAAINTKYFS